MELIDIIGSACIGAILIHIYNRLSKKKKKKKDNRVKVDFYLPYTKEELLCYVVFGLLAIPAWGFALWIFLKSGFSWEQLIMCLLITIAGLAFLLLHRVSHGVRVPEGKEHLAEAVKLVLAKSNRLMSLFCFPFMAAYLISKSPSLFGIGWDFEWVSIGIMVLAIAISISMQTYYSKKLHIDITSAEDVTYIA